MDDDLTIRDVMSPEYVGVSEGDAIGEVAEVLLADGVPAVVVLRGSRATGIVTDRRLLEAIAVEGFELDDPVGDIMIDPGQGLRPEVPIVEAVSSLTTEDMDHLLVMDGDEIVGTVSAADLVVSAASMLTESEIETGMRGPIDTERAGFEQRDDYSTQSVCEVCGTFAPDLQNINGQLVCADCRSV